MNEWHLRNSRDFAQFIVYAVGLWSSSTVWEAWNWPQKLYPVDTVLIWQNFRKCEEFLWLLTMQIRCLQFLNQTIKFGAGWLHGRKKKWSRCYSIIFQDFIFSWTMSGRWRQMMSIINLTKTPEGQYIMQGKCIWRSTWQKFTNQLNNNIITITAALNIYWVLMMHLVLC